MRSNRAQVSGQSFRGTSTGSVITESERPTSANGDGPEDRLSSRSGPERAQATRSALPRMAIGLVIAGLLWLIGLGRLSLVFVVASLVVTVASVSLPRFGTWLESTIQRLAAPIGRATTTVLMAFLFVFVFVPVALALRLLRRDPLTAPGTDAGSNWTVRRSVPPADLVRRQFTLEADLAMPEQRSRLSATLGVARVTLRILVVILVLDFAAGTAYNAATEARGPADNRVGMPAFAGQDWVAGYFEEKNETDQNAVWQPLLGLVRADYSGDYVNIENMARRTYQSAAVDTDSPSVFFFGGSTAFGMGQRDLYTISSHLARMAEEEGVALEVTNYGQGGWVIWQEVALLSQLLGEGKVPDVAIFYNGLNETGLQLQDLTDTPTYPRAEQIQQETAPRTIGRVLQDVASEYAEHSIIFRLDVLSESVPQSPELTEVRAINAVELHARAVDVIESLAESYGFETIFLWQPVAFTKDKGEQAVWSQSYENQGGFSDVYARTTALIEPPVIDLTDSLDHINVPVFVDAAHTNEAGAEGVAQAIYPYLLETLEDRDG